MNIKIFIAGLLALFFGENLLAQKEIYIPNQMYEEGYSETDESRQWCKIRSRESDNIIVFWANGYGQNDPNSGSVPSEYRVDVDDLLKKLESFYDLYIHQLKFAEVGVGKSNLDKYKMIICLYYTTDWMAYGSGFDDLIGGMWISPSTCHPVGSTIAHEMGHSFQYQCYCDLKGYAGFRYEVGQGNGYWEQTAQWQSFQAYPEQAFTTYDFSVYKQNHHRAFTHEWQRYASYFFHYYQVDKRGRDIIGRIWRGNSVKGADANQVYMNITGLSDYEFYAECYDAAAKFATWDLDEIRDYGKKYIGSQQYNYIDLGNGKLQVAYSSTPQSTGYNVIPLQLPFEGNEVATIFTALPAGEPLAEGDPGICNKKDDGSFETTTKYNTFDGASKRGFRLGYVALLTNGERVYHSLDTVFSLGNNWQSDTLRFAVPEGAERMWFVVSPAPASYIVHKWDEQELNDDQWPYQLQFENTDIVGHVNIGDPDDEISDTTLHLNVRFELSATEHSGATAAISSANLEALGVAFKLQPIEIAALMKQWSQSPADNTITLWAIDPTTGELQSSGSTANGYGHWFDESGKVNSYYNSIVYSEFDASALTFTVGQFPGKLTDGQKISFGQALVYQKEGKRAVARIIFHVIVGTETTTHIQTVRSEEKRVDVYNLQGVELYRNVYRSTIQARLREGLYLIGGEKIYIYK